MRVLFDTDVIIDIVLGREPFAEFAGILLDAAQDNKIQGYIAWHSISNIYYICSGNTRKVKSLISDITDVLDIPETSTSALKTALRLPMKDFEDAMQVAAAMTCKADMIATRNLAHYRASPISVYTPEKIVDQFR